MIVFKRNGVGITFPILIHFTAIECPNINLANGVITYMPDSSPEFAIGTVAFISCNVSFALVGSKTRMCMDDDQADNIGVWNGSLPICQCKHFHYNFVIS